MGDDMYVVVDGTVSVRVEMEQGGDLVATEVATPGPGDVVGEMAVILGTPRTATVAARDEEVRLLRIDGRAFRTRLLYRPDVSPILMETLANRLRDVSRLISGVEARQAPPSS